MKELNVNVYVNKDKYDIYKTYSLPADIFNKFSTDYEKCNFRVTSMNSVSLNGLKKISSFTSKYDKIIGFQPTGWCYDPKNKNNYIKKESGKVILYELPYSEHSSFTEIIDFIKTIKYKAITPTVNLKTTVKQLKMLEEYKTK